jgi:hypothetical protein
VRVTVELAVCEDEAVPVCEPVRVAVELAVWLLEPVCDAVVLAV